MQPGSSFTASSQTPATVLIVGAQWGDEGKAKVTDLLAEKADLVVRCQGGCNAGHTVRHQGETYKFHLVPSGVLYLDVHCVVGSGVVIHPEMLQKELEGLKARGIDLSRLRISDRAHLTMPYHVQQDHQAEGAATQKIGTTGRGIGPTYMDKVGRIGLRMGDLLEDDTYLAARLQQILEAKACWLDAAASQNGERFELAALLEQCRQWRAYFGPYITETVSLINDAIDAGQRVLFEGAQGTLLDVDYGTYPFVTSSNATAGGLCTGSGVGPTRIAKALGIMKAYTTRVGEGPFPTELFDAAGDHLVTVGQEFGTTTGRKRRCGWFDAVIGRFSVQVNGLTGVCLTKLDVLTGLPELKIATAYRDTRTGNLLPGFPSNVNQLANVEPVYETMPGWTAPFAGNETRVDQLPENAQRYVARLQELLGCPIVLVSTGPERGETIINEPVFEDAGVLAGC